MLIKQFRHFFKFKYPFLFESGFTIRPYTVPENTKNAQNSNHNQAILIKWGFTENIFSPYHT